ncbi:hypothetical protein E2C01_003712 [Portunus trituberculatus]|uniref:Uncharacterized protein n=1 Tax=Portunus trituberculatus TaxID=210409 RepID=A0A5B7CNQ1_PORTR|nr:hypothetical protein [Portunus trituberculatus]
MHTFPFERLPSPPPSPRCRQGVTAVCPPSGDTDDWLLRLSLEPETPQICSVKVKYSYLVYAICYGRSIGAGHPDFQPYDSSRYATFMPQETNIGVSVEREK